MSLGGNQSSPNELDERSDLIVHWPSGCFEPELTAHRRAVRRLPQHALRFEPSAMLDNRYLANFPGVVVAKPCCWRINGAIFAVGCC